MYIDDVAILFVRVLFLARRYQIFMVTKMMSQRVTNGIISRENCGYVSLEIFKAF